MNIETDFVPEEFRKRLSSSTLFPRDLIEPIVNYFIRTEMMKTACPTLSDLNLIGNSSIRFFLSVFSFRICCYDEDLRSEDENELKNGGFCAFTNYLKSFIPNDT